MREKMKVNVKRIVICSLGVLTFLVATSSNAWAQTPSSGWIEGWLTASQITASGSGSIEVWKKKLNCKTESECAQKLVAGGDKYVLVMGKDMYQLSDQKMVAEYAGTSVNIQGVLNNQKKTIEVNDIQSLYDEWMAGYVTASQIAAAGTTDLGITMKKFHCQDGGVCAQKLVAAGDKYVLVIGKDVYQLSDQKRAAEHTGMIVMVKGILNHQRKTVTVEDIQDIQDCG